MMMQVVHQAIKKESGMRNPPNPDLMNRTSPLGYLSMASRKKPWSSFDFESPSIHLEILPPSGSRHSVPFHLICSRIGSELPAIFWSPAADSQPEPCRVKPRIRSMPPQPRVYRPRRAKEPSTSKPSLGVRSKIMKKVEGVEKLYKEHIPKNIQAEIDCVEAEAQGVRGCLSDEEVRQDFEELLQDPGYHRGRVVLHQKTLDLAWTLKYLMGKALVQRGEEHEEILLTLDEILKNQQKIATHMGMELNSDEETPRCPESSQDIKADSE